MHKTLFLAAAGLVIGHSAIAADFDGPPQDAFSPAPMVQADVDLYGGFFSSEGLSTSVFGGDGRINVPFQNWWNLQMDAQFFSQIFSGGSAATQGGGFAHFYKRDPNQYAIGFLGGFEQFGISSGAIGIEGQRYFDRFTLYGQGIVRILSGSNGEIWSLRGQLLYYCSDNTTIAGDLMYADGSGMPGGSSVITAILSAEHRFDNPFSLFARLRFDTSPGISLDAFTGVVGLRIFADPPGSTLKSHERTGPPMNVLPLFFPQQS